jgi:hypothetical protein
VSLQVSPASLELVGPRAEARVLVTARLADGSLRDVTDHVTETAANAGLLLRDPDGTLHPLKDGATTLQFAYGGRHTTLKVRARDTRRALPISFKNEIEPVLTRLGCNQGACHGAQYGKGGFKLSLAAFDPDLDYTNIVRQTQGRRVSPADPERSLLLLKPTMRVRHGGGLRLEPGSVDYRLLVRWLRDGAAAPVASDPEVTRLEVLPAERVMQPGGMPQRLIVRAVYSDGATRDVTPHARIATLNDAIASCSPEGLVRPVGCGQTAVMVRYAGQATVSTIVVPFKNLPAQDLTSGPFPLGKGRIVSGLAALKPEKLSPIAALTGKRQSGATSDKSSPLPFREGGMGGLGSGSAQIDALVARKQQQLGLEPSPLCDDRTFVRRVFFDLIGTAPTADEIARFLADRSADRRARLIDALLARPEYADYWALKWGDLLRCNRTALGSPKGMWSFANWIHTQLQENRPVDQFAQDLILAQGSTYTNGPANYYRVAQAPPDLAETTSQVFLGVRMQCARCHHHPFEKWSQTDYYQLAAYFARVGVKGSNEFGQFGGEQIVKVNDGGEVTHPKTGAVMRPTPLGAQLANLPANKLPDPDRDGDRRRALAAWLTSPSNRLFARNIANRYWGYLFTKGIVNPIDDQRVTNPPTNPELLDFLADELVRGKYDLKHLLRVICNSQTYQRSSAATPANRTDELFFTHYLPRRLPAEAMLDAVDFACGTREKFPELPAGVRAIQLPDPNVGSEFLDAFGRPARLISCECERVAEPNLTQTLKLMNGDQINGKVSAEDGRVTKLLAARKPDDAIITDLYVATLGRPPRPRERNEILGALIFAPDRKPVYQDVLLTLLNSKEFLFNH